MSILVDWQIRLEAAYGMIEPFNEEQVNPASYDVLLGNEVQVAIHDSKSFFHYMDISGATENEPVWLRHNQFWLAHTQETFNLPSDIAAQFMLKSSRAREGIQHLMAGYCDPGWHGSKLTLELVNHHPMPVPLWPGMKIGQMIFHRLSGTPERTYAVTGRYNNDSTVSISKG